MRLSAGVRLPTKQDGRGFHGKAAGRWRGPVAQRPLGIHARDQSWHSGREGEAGYAGLAPPPPGCLDSSQLQNFEIWLPTGFWH